ncbi:MAG TPA: hypothetical protein VK011_05735 [Acidimicrobiia bacterium]|nr:hypothetical protein [Acidimicrobiia bacterium]
MRDMVCRAARTTLIARVLDTGSPPSLLESHIATCLRCQATVAHSQRLRRTLARMDVPMPGEVTTARMEVPWLAAAAASVIAALLWVRLRQQQG